MLVVVYDGSLCKTLGIYGHNTSSLIFYLHFFSTVVGLCAVDLVNKCDSSTRLEEVEL